VKNYVKNQDVRIIHEKGTKKPLFVEYLFDDGSVSRIAIEEIGPDWYSFIKDEIKEEHRIQCYEERHRLSYDKKSRELINIEECEDVSLIGVSEQINREESDKRACELLSAFLPMLTEVQKRRFLLKFNNPEYSMAEIARIEKADESSIRECFEAIQKKFLKNFSKNTPGK